MWVSHLEIENIRSFSKKETLTFDKRINILLGANNSGKSTIIRAIHQMQGPFLIHEDVRIGIEKGNICISLEEVDHESIRSWISHGYQSKLYIEGVKGQSGALPVILKPLSPHSPNPRGFNFPKVEPFNFIYPYLSKRKVGGYDRNISRNLARDIQETLVHLTAKVDELSNPYHPKHQEFEQSCRSILGFAITAFAAPDNNGKQIGIIVSDHDVIPLEAMGEGVPNLLGLIVSLCFAKNQLFLIEELENDIHPRALKSLLELIIKKAKYNQFIVSTHSNIVVKYLGSEPGAKIHQISMLELNDNNKIPTTTYKEIGNTEKERRVVLEDLGYDLFDYSLASGWIFLEESSAETFVKDYLIRWFTPNLSGKINTIAAQGTGDVVPKFNDFNRLFLFIHLEKIYQNCAWVICDGDASGIEVTDKLKTLYLSGGNWSADKFINLSKHNFEEYYPSAFDDDIKQIINIKDRQNKRKAKKDLLEKVVAWTKADEDKAKAEFAISAKEVITVLKNIEASII